MSQELGKSIELPQWTGIVFRDIQGAKILAMDIGGSLTKIAVYSTISHKKIIYDPRVRQQTASQDGSKRVQIEIEGDAMYAVSEGARLHFIKFETKHIDYWLAYIHDCLSVNKNEFQQKSIKVTGGGAYKYSERIKEMVGLPIDKCDEMRCIVRGCNFLLKNISDESFIYQRKGNPEFVFQTIDPRSMFPYLLVTIGSGVSIIKVTGDNDFERIGGTATGGGTFWALGRLLTQVEGFDELLALASEGDHRNVDMLVKDIYGDRQDYQSLGLPADLIASSMGKAIQSDSDWKKFSKADIARSLLYMISNDIGQISSLYAMLHEIKTIYFGGFFLRHHPVSMHTVRYSVNYWTKGKVQARFLRHEGYLGAIGAFLKGAQTIHAEDYSWLENLYGSTGFSSPQNPVAPNFELDHLEIDRFEKKLRFCPLLQDPLTYNPDTVDLTRDNDAREYWLQCLQDSLPKFTERAIKSQDNSSSVQDRANKFKDQFLTRLKQFKHNPFAYGNLTVRGLLDLREHCLAEFDFYDPYRRQKQYENDQAFDLLPDLLQKLSQLDWEERQKRLAIGVLAGNVFDWGAKEVALIMEDKGLDFQTALSMIGPRPWLVDSLDAWIERLRNGSRHKCVAIFIDNSGVDVILGILPFVEELLRRGSEVLLCANNKPVLNDVTYGELLIILQRAAKVSDLIAKALESNQLICLDSGQGSPCLDLTKLNKTVVDVMLEKQVDLLVLEGMGRAVHTNLYTCFNCECLKIAVLKNRWLAERLGGEMYAVIFKFEEPGGSVQPQQTSEESNGTATK